MNTSDIYEHTQRYLRAETALNDLRRWVFENLPELLPYEDTPESDLASLLVWCFCEYDIGGLTEEEIANKVRRFLKSKRARGLAKAALSPRQP
jgi:hypothetical protein